MTQRVSESLVAVLIRIGLLLALVIMLMAENAQAQPLHGKALSLSTARVRLFPDRRSEKLAPSDTCWKHSI
jgi:hypothetical protein